MTTDRITRMAYAFSVGLLSGLNYGLWPGLLVGPGITALCIATGELFGTDS